MTAYQVAEYFFSTAAGTRQMMSVINAMTKMPSIQRIIRPTRRKNPVPDPWAAICGELSHAKRHVHELFPSYREPTSVIVVNKKTSGRRFAPAALKLVARLLMRCEVCAGLGTEVSGCGRDTYRRLPLGESRLSERAEFSCFVAR